jgi:hypothetical protein
MYQWQPVEGSHGEAFAPLCFDGAQHDSLFCDVIPPSELLGF